MADAAQDELTAAVEKNEAEKIQRILAAVRQKAKNQIPVPSITGLVVGGDEQELQVATQTGIVGVPVKQILRTVHPIPSREDIATFYLPDLEEIRTIFPVKPIRAIESNAFGGGLDRATAAGNQAVVSAGTFTHTAVAGESMTAGEVAGVNSDDCEVHYQNDDSYD